MPLDKMLPDELRKVATENFLDMDTDNNGWISREELKEGYSKLGFNMTDQMAEQVFREVDTDKNGKITLDEFFLLIKKACDMFHQEAERAKLRRAITKWDTNQNGFLSNDELMNGLQKAGIAFTKEELEKMTANLPKDGNGRMELERVVEAIISN